MLERAQMKDTGLVAPGAKEDNGCYGQNTVYRTYSQKTEHSMGELKL